MLPEACCHIGRPWMLVPLRQRAQRRAPTGLIFLCAGLALDSGPRYRSTIWHATQRSSGGTVTIWQDQHLFCDGCGCILGNLTRCTKLEHSAADQN